MGTDSRMPSPSDKLVPGRLGGYTVLRELSPGTWLAMAGRRRVVLKPLPADCLLAGQLHPLVRDRLAHVRGLACGSLANLHGVERDADRVFLVWDYIEGEPLGSCGHRVEVLRAVEALHARGVVHGAIKPGNVIIAADGSVRLTHVSPLLYHDPEIDRAAIDAMFQGRDARPLDGGVAADPAADPAASRGVRRRALAAAALATAAGLLLAGGLWHFARQATAARSTAPADPPAAATGGER